MKRKSFSEIHHEGSAYGWMWFSANEAAVKAAGEHGVNVRINDPKLKTAVSAIVLAILDRLNERDSLILDPPPKVKPNETET